MNYTEILSAIENPRCDYTINIYSSLACSNKTKNSNNSNGKYDYIIIVIAGLVILVLIILFVLWCIRRHRQISQKPKPTFEATTIQRLTQPTTENDSLTIHEPKKSDYGSLV